MIVAKTRIGGLKPEVTYEELKAVMVKWVGGTQPMANKVDDTNFDGVQIQD